MSHIEVPHEGEHKHHIEHHIAHHSDDADLHWRLHVLARVVSRCQNLDQHESTQPKRVGTQTRRRHSHITLGERAILEQGRQDGLCKNPERNRCGHRDKQHISNGPDQCLRERI